jgi:hypothetical protein
MPGLSTSGLRTSDAAARHQITILAPPPEP